MIRPVFVPALIILAITRATLAAAAYVHHHLPNPNIYHFNHLLPRQDPSLVESDIPAPATPAAPSSLPTTLVTAAAVADATTDTTNISSTQPSVSIPNDGNGAPTTTTPTNELIFPLDPTTSSSSQSSTQHGTSPQSSTSSSTSSLGPNAVATTMSQLGQSSPSTTIMMDGSTAVSTAQSVSFQLGSGSSMGTGVVTAAGPGPTGLDIEPGSDVMSSGAARRIVRDGRFWAALVGIFGAIWI